MAAKWDLSDLDPNTRARLAILNPELRSELLPEVYPDPSKQMELLLGAQVQNAAIWLRLEEALAERRKVLQALSEARKPHYCVTPIQVAGLLIFLALLLTIIGGY